MKKLTLHQIVWYFFIFSIFGMIMENIFCFISTRNIESRKGFIIGPFCPIYGIGAIILLILLGKQKNKWYNILLGGMFIGSAFEYISSYIIQALYSIKFWDYKNYFLNINGRTALIYAIYWGILSLLLIYFLEPITNNFIKKYRSKSLDLIILSFMTINGLITYKALNLYVSRTELKLQNKTVQKENDFNIKNNEDYFNNLMSDEVMKYIFPNAIYITKNNNAKVMKNL